MTILKRYSTYANFASLVIAAAIASVGGFGLSSEVVAGIMMAGNVAIAVCQFIKQEAGKDV